MSSTYVVSVSVPRRVQVSDPAKSTVSTLAREDFFSWLWNRFSSAGLVGVHEGTLLTEDAAEKGFEAEAWTVDSAEAPPSRDWVAEQELESAELYFDSEPEAKDAAAVLVTITELTSGFKVNGIREQKPQDWDADWKASFLNAGAGVPISPFWRVVPPWVKLDPRSEKFIKINPGAGFGTGTHETTQLCLQAIGEYSQRISIEGQPALDFGSGSGILAVAMAILGAKVDAVEVDSLAIDNSVENAELNEVREKISFMQELPLLLAQGSSSADLPVHSNSVPTYRYVVANILRPVLLEFASQLIERLRPGGVLVLSGLIERDVKPVVEKYASLLNNSVPQIYAQGEWRAVVFLKPQL
ncbi:MAG: 50S ribosomal protein L11 methyltransferase [Bdellovibrionia bacterium]